MNTNDQLQTHIPDPSLLRVRAVNTQGNAVIGYLVCFQRLAFVISNGLLQQVNPDSIQPYVPAIDGYLGDILHGTETGEYNSLLSSWTGTVIWDDDTKSPRIKDDSEADLYPPDDYQFDKLQPAMTANSQSLSNNFNMLTATMLLTDAINNGLRLITVFGESDAQKYGYTIRNCIRCFPGANKTAYVFRIAVHTATRKDCQCREGDTSVVTVYSDGRIVADD